MKTNVCPACGAKKNGVKSRIAFEHTCGEFGEHLISLAPIKVNVNFIITNQFVRRIDDPGKKRKFFLHTYFNVNEKEQKDIRQLSSKDALEILFECSYSGHCTFDDGATMTDYKRLNDFVDFSKIENQEVQECDASKAP